MEDQGHYAAKILWETFLALPKCLGFMEGTVHEIVWKDDTCLQDMCYKGHEMKKWVNLQTVKIRLEC